MNDPILPIGYWICINDIVQFKRKEPDRQDIHMSDWAFHYNGDRITTLKVRYCGPISFMKLLRKLTDEDKTLMALGMCPKELRKNNVSQISYI